MVVVVSNVPHQVPRSCFDEKSGLHRNSDSLNCECVQFRPDTGPYIDGLEELTAPTLTDRLSHMVDLKVAYKPTSRARLLWQSRGAAACVGLKSGCAFEIQSKDSMQIAPPVRFNFFNRPEAAYGTILRPAYFFTSRRWHVGKCW
jgi:hypothetical protein